MRDVIKAIIFVLFGLSVYTAGAVAHEGDLTRQCDERGVMRPFFSPEYKCNISAPE